MIAIVCGGRDYANYVRVCQTLDALKPSFIIQGGARGADALGAAWALDRGVPMAEVKAQWMKYGKSAGHKRNGWMLLLKPDIVVAFPGNTGTADMVQQAKDAGIKVIQVLPE